jgi:hypothetical protein
LSCESILIPSDAKNRSILSTCKKPVEHLGIEAFQKAVEKIDDDYYHRIFKADENYLDKGYLFGWKIEISNKGIVKTKHTFTEDIYNRVQPLPS